MSEALHFLSDKEKYELHQRFLNDPVLKAYNHQLHTVYANSIPSYKFNPGTGELTAMYNAETESIIEGIKTSIRTYIKTTYPQLIVTE